MISCEPRILWGGNTECSSSSQLNPPTPSTKSEPSSPIIKWGVRVFTATTFSATAISDICLHRCYLPHQILIHSYLDLVPKCRTLTVNFVLESHQPPAAMFIYVTGGSDVNFLIPSLFTARLNRSIAIKQPFPKREVTLYCTLNLRQCCHYKIINIGRIFFFLGGGGEGLRRVSPGETSAHSVA